MATVAEGQAKVAIGEATEWATEQPSAWGQAYAFAAARDALLKAPAWAPAARIVILVTGDLAAIAIAVLAAYLVWGHAVLGQPASLYWPAVPLALLFPLSYAAAGLYPGFGLGSVEILRRLSCSTSLVFVTVAALSFAFKLPHTYSRGAFALAWCGALVLVPSVRRWLGAWLAQRNWWQKPAVLIAESADTEKILRALQDVRLLGYRVVGAFGHAAVRALGAFRPSVVGPLAAAPSAARAGVEVAVVAELFHEHESVSQLQRYFPRVLAVSFGETSSVQPRNLVSLGGAWGMELVNNLLEPANQVIKRFVDICLGSVLLVVASPVIAVAALAVQVLSPGPVFFAQEREGLNGRRIRVWKLRTMCPDAEKRLADYLSRDGRLREEWERRCKLSRDPRVVPVVGSFLRKFSIDELPQILAVVKGELSLVGPRPLPYYHLDRFDERFRNLRRKVRPGLTGMWQVFVRSDGRLADQVRLDEYYIRNWSIWLDIYLLSRTVAAVLSGRGAV